MHITRQAEQFQPLKLPPLSKIELEQSLQYSTIQVNKGQVINSCKQWLVQQTKKIQKHIKKEIVLALLFALIFALWFSNNWAFFEQYISIKNLPMQDHLKLAVNQLDDLVPGKYLGVEELAGHYGEIPTCLVVDKSAYGQEQLRKSIENQDYSSYKVVEFDFGNESGNNLDSYTSSSREFARNSYYSLMDVLDKKCPERSILMFPNRPLARNALKVQNYYFQEYNTWLLYSLDGKQDQPESSEVQGGRRRVSKQTERVEIISVYRRIFQLLHNNDFGQINRQLLKIRFDEVHVMTGLFELTKFYALEISSKELFETPNQANSLLFFNPSSTSASSAPVSRLPYQPMHSLNQNYKRDNIPLLNKNRQRFMTSNKTITSAIVIEIRSNKVSHEEMMRALHFEQIIYLPESHALNSVEKRYYEKKYQISKYEKELPLCINVNSHNNMQNERYKKVMDSITAQKYQNYRIVFIDDFSSDETLAKTKQYLEDGLGFPKERVTYVRNKVQKRATFNIVNAGFNFCQKDSIQLLIDGDDQLIGRQVFQLVNAQYQADNLWAFYTFYKTDKYQEGASLKFKEEYLTGFFGGRRLIYFYGHLKSFKTSLLKHIPLSEHLNEFGNFHDTMYDTALQYPLFQLSAPYGKDGKGHGKSIDEMAYLYFSGYGDNDDSSLLKSTRRNQLHVWISFRKKLQPIKELDIQYEDKDVRSQLQAEKKDFQVIF